MPGPRDQVEDRDWTTAETDDPAVRSAQRLAANLAQAMQDQGLTLEALAVTAGVSAATISNTRNGRSWPSVLVVARLEDALGTALWPPHGN